MTPPRGALTPEQAARQTIDALLSAAGWAVQNLAEVNLHVARDVAIREFPLVEGHGTADYLLYVDGRACGVIEAWVACSLGIRKVRTRHVPFSTRCGPSY